MATLLLACLQSREFPRKHLPLSNRSLTGLEKKNKGTGGRQVCLVGGLGVSSTFSRAYPLCSVAFCLSVRHEGFSRGASPQAHSRSLS
jgi:hypothetical protein